ncbi:flagellar motor switch phosphatase FliY [Heyndrickxia coagulans]|uniref:flagellar motor switch phosphatase FliY n=1 Tax=Heyndrickxia coagulans TaxID=1398 RepID=UPI00037F347A|nr:flagellar motor switch phosphatase FliY [Heyndrickxia coagulans]MED4934571.1 flagellar motor switch phosphatase FliY [Heyndrickxia coagulans]
MSDDMLSQEEIDALLNGTANLEDASAKDALHVEDYLDSMERDALGEIGNISFGSSATALSTLLSQKVEITTPEVSIVRHDKLADEFPHPYVAIQVKYTEGFSGVNVLVIKQSDAAIIADLMLGGTGENPSSELDEIHLSAVQEAMNQMMGSAATSMSTIFNKRIDISPPAVSLLNILEGEGTDKLPDQDLLVKVSFRIMIGSLIDSQIMQLLPLSFAKKLVSDLIHPEQPAEAGKKEGEKQPDQNVRGHAAEKPAEPAQNAEKQETHQNVQPAVFTSFEETAPRVETKNLDMLLDIPLEVTVELGRTSKTVREILEMGAGSIVELDKLAGEPVDILINHQLIAIGEVVVIDENFGVRVTDIVSQKDRLKKLR